MYSIGRRALLHPLTKWSENEYRILRVLLYVATGLIVLAVTAQRSFYPHPHWTFWIFRASFWHLMRGQNLYAHYGNHDLFKYSPTAALLFAPFAIPPFALGLLLWNALNAAALIAALSSLLKRGDETLAVLLVLPELFIALQASQSNALVVSLILFAFVALERGKQLRGMLAIATGVAIKLFPIAALSFALFHPKRARAVLAFALSTLMLLLLPLTVTSPSMLLAQYGWWRGVEATDAVARGASLMQMLHRAFGVTWPNWPLQLAGVIVLLMPLLRRARWGDRGFRLRYLASLLVFVVIFNHQAERPSFVIAATGVAIWFVESARDRNRLVLVLLSLSGFLAWGYLPVWAVMQCELHGVSLARLSRGRRGHLMQQSLDA